MDHLFCSQIICYSGCAQPACMSKWSWWQAWVRVVRFLIPRLQWPSLVGIVWNGLLLATFTRKSAIYVYNSTWPGCDTGIMIFILSWISLHCYLCKVPFLVSYPVCCRRCFWWSSWHFCSSCIFYVLQLVNAEDAWHSGDSNNSEGDDDSNDWSFVSSFPSLSSGSPGVLSTFNCCQL